MVCISFAQAHGQRAAWEDPSDWILETYPFQLKSDAAQTSLLKVRAEDVGYDVSAHAQNGEQSGQRSRTQSDADSDPLVSSPALKIHVHLRKNGFLIFILFCLVAEHAAAPAGGCQLLERSEWRQ